jgi:serine/threonine protein kinase
MLASSTSKQSEQSEQTISQIVYTGKSVLNGIQGAILHANLVLQNQITQQMAVKVWKESMLKEESEMERKVLLDLQGTKGIARLVSFPGANQYKDRIFLDWAEEGDLFTLIERFQNKINPPNLTHVHIHQMFEQLLTAAESINKLGYIHRDIKPENVLVYKLTEDKIDVGLSDFGLVFPLHVVTGVAGTINYLPPTCQGVAWHKYDGSEDLYGVGITVGLILRFLDKEKFKEEIRFSRTIRKSGIRDLPDLFKKLKELRGGAVLQGAVPAPLTPR